MSAPAPPTQSLPLHRLEEPETIDDVIRTIDDIIGWAIKAESLRQAAGQATRIENTATAESPGRADR
jgi:hypothetical protein